MIASFNRFWKILDREDRGQVVIALLLVVFGAVFEMIGVGLLPILVAVLSSPRVVLAKLAALTHRHEIEAWPTPQVVLLTIATVSVFFVFKNLFSMWTTFRLGRFKARIQGKLGRKMIHGYLNAPYDWHLQHSSAAIQQTMQQEVTLVVSRIIAPAFVLLSEVAIILLVVGLLMLVAPVATLLTGAVILLVSAAYAYIFNVKLQRLGEQQKEKNAALFQCVQQGLGGVKELMVLGRTAFFEKEYDRLVDDVTRADQFQVTIATNVKAVLEGVAAVCLSLTVFLALEWNYDLQALLPSLALFAVAAVRLMPSANRLVTEQTRLKYGMPGFRKLLDDVEEVERFELVPAAAPMPEEERPRFNGQLTLDGVSYRYPLAASESLREITLTIPQGASIGFVGPSGAGKTTLVDLILGLLKPTVGVILADGKNIHAGLAAWRRQIGYIPQQIYLSDATVRANVAFGLPAEEIDDERVWAALKSAHLGGLVESWPERLDKTIGERGVRLSGGQRQRIGIARALYHNPAILVLDEATAALDNETEREIVSVMESFHGERTMLTVAHRLTTVQRCDRLFYLSAGQLIASGSYRELEETCEPFRRMIQAAKAKSEGI